MKFPKRLAHEICRTAGMMIQSQPFLITYLFWGGRGEKFKQFTELVVLSSQRSTIFCPKHATYRNNHCND